MPLTLLSDNLVSSIYLLASCLVLGSRGSLFRDSSKHLVIALRTAVFLSCGQIELHPRVSSKEVCGPPEKKRKLRYMLSVGPLI